jgi:hypothetical protein
MWKAGLSLTITLCPLLSSVIVSPATADVRRLAAIPASFSGSWASTADACKSQGNPLLTISAKAYAGPQENCTVLSVSETAGVQGSIYSSRLQCRNIQTKKARSVTVILRQESADRISVGPDFSSLKAYDRCAAATPAPR